MRGEHVAGQSSYLLGGRISPACAGNTRHLRLWMPRRPDQPRVRGEHDRPRHAVELSHGSAPRARGTRYRPLSGRSRSRISPACAGNTGALPCQGCIAPDQPRVRGEHPAPTPAEHPGGGSAPRARGTPTPAEPRRGPHRISPACAGNTVTVSPSHRRTTDQPRVRGEHLFDHVKPRGEHGSAPRARGTRSRPHAPGRRRRISPACAGNTGGHRARQAVRADQPRVRGEHGLVSCAALSRGGSAPRARGTRKLIWMMCKSLRISPACAGNTLHGDGTGQAGTDQPRVRGEHYDMPADIWTADGSAPRARGTRGHAVGQADDERISPACAGNTGITSCPSTGPTDQPRVRGEHNPRTAIVAGNIGSAPRARGTRRPPLRYIEHCRISPACAGNTTAERMYSSTDTDQPRVRGEHNWVQFSTNSAGGSAPRARGTHPHPSLPIRPHRISPACAGNTTAPRPVPTAPSDQPRVRGEHRRRPCGFDPLGGSAPRARGTRIAPFDLGRISRISPACAGNTEVDLGSCCMVPDQPRVRGEHAIARRWPTWASGSAPRARGTRYARQFKGVMIRISPACAGNTSLARASPASHSDQPRVRGEHIRRPGGARTGGGSAPRARGTPPP